MGITDLIKTHQYDLSRKSNFDLNPWKRFMQTIVQFYRLDKKGLVGSAMRALFEKGKTVAAYTNYSGGTPPETLNWGAMTVPSRHSAA